jgi:hypothetical protein
MIWDRLLEEERRSRLEFEKKLDGKVHTVSQQMGTKQTQANQVIIVICLRTCKIIFAYLRC